MTPNVPPLVGLIAETPHDAWLAPYMAALGASLVEYLHGEAIDTASAATPAGRQMAPRTPDPLAIVDAAMHVIQRGARRLVLYPDAGIALARVVGETLGVPCDVGHADAREVDGTAPPDTRDAAPNLAPGTAHAAGHFKVGVVGGVGPAATVDFLGKLVAQTPARVDQEHVKVVLEQNPQIPDRTAHLLGRSDIDPSVALYAACRAVVAGGAHVIAIPCNTAHAYVPKMQARLAVPIVNMLDEAIDYIVARYGTQVRIGLLATDGTIESGVYARAAAARGVALHLPSPEMQAKVMRAIYGPEGVKAGFVDGVCRQDLMAALQALVRESGTQVVMLGCTELPLIVPHTAAFDIAGNTVSLVDPTLVLAARCVALAGKRPYLQDEAPRGAAPPAEGQSDRRVEHAAR